MIWYKCIWSLLTLSALCSAGPTVTVKNGTYEGVHLTTYDQDAFLGVPYAQPPVGSLRFVVPQALNQTWQGNREAIAYSNACYSGVSIHFINRSSVS
jgi:carboxylesterase type B